MHVDGGVEGVGAWRGAFGEVPALYEGGGGKEQGEAGCVRDTQTERPGEGPFPSPDQELMIASVPVILCSFNPIMIPSTIIHNSRYKKVFLSVNPLDFFYFLSSPRQKMSIAINSPK